MTTANNRLVHPQVATQRRNGEPVSTSPSAIECTMPDTPTGNHSSGNGHISDDAHTRSAVAGTKIPADQVAIDFHSHGVGGEQTEDESAATNDVPMPIGEASLADPFLALAADILDDSEQTKIANENRLRQLTRIGTDADGEERGFGLDESHPDVANLATLVELLGKVEHQAVLQLQRKMRKHPLGPWVKAQRGIGEKQAARLLAAIGDPYWNTLHGRPRTVSELWAYCGLHVLPAGQYGADLQLMSADGESSPAGGDHDTLGTHTGRVAARRRKGQKTNWSTTAKTRAYLISESMLRAGNREIYDRRKATTAGKLHDTPCAPCGPKSKPAQPGSPWSDAHRHADALRIQSKELLKNLWREAKRLHTEGGDD